MADDSAGAASASAASCPAASLVPSQAVNSRTSSSEGGDGGGPGRGGGGGGGGNRRRNRGRGGGGEKQPNRADGGATEAADGENENRGGGDGGDGGDAGREGGGNKRGRRNRGRGKRRGSQASAAEADAGSAAAAGAAAEDGDGKPPADGGRGRGSRTPPRRGRKKGGGRGGGRGGRDDETGGRGRGGRGGGRGRNRGGGRRGGGQDARFPWRALIPRGAVDPISLDPLNRLPYPPFALSATEPYEVIGEWPVPEPGAAKGGKGGKETEEERQKRREREIMAEQWGATYAVSALNSDGDMITGSQNATEASAEGEAPATGDDGADEKKKPRYLHLYDGRVLAYYLVSQLQFIDPLNRRDLTRPELVNLDEYLRRHRLGKAGVAEAYDAQGVTISSAGAAGHTDEGRARRLQQEAEVLLRSLVADDGTARRGGLEGGADFAEVGNGRRGRRGGHPPAVVQSGTPSHFQNDFERQYVESERRRDAKHGPRSQSQPSHQHQAQAPAPAQAQEDAGIYHERGVLMIDDDMNPGLRAGLPAAAAAARRSSDPGGDYPPLGDGAAASGGGGGIGFGYGDLSAYRHEERVRADAFPALQPSAPREDTKPPAVGARGTGAGAGAGAKPAAQAAKPAAGKPSKSLLKIAGTITKTDPAEVERQRRAREEAQRRAALANQSFVPPGAQVYQQPIGMEIGGGPGRDPFAAPERTEAAGPSEGQLERNRNLASALGVAPSTVRAGGGDQKPSFHSGWARPSVPHVAHDEFGNELFTAHYPDALIVLAREKMDVLLKLERRWKTFLEDDKAASHPLRPMPRESRRLVHEYAVYWNLKTESFDPEPKRYVHCVKLRDTAAPHPLLSRAARTWRGPGTGGPALPPVASGGVVPAAGASRPQPCVSRIPHPPSNPNLQQAAGQSTLGGNASAREFPHPTEGPRAPLQLQPRSVPAPPVQAMGGAAPPPGAMFDMDVAASALPPPPAGQASKSSNGEVAGAGGRFAGLFEAEGRSRPKLELAPRTVPLELPPYDPSSGAGGAASSSGYDPLAEAKSREAERARAARARERKEKAKARILADAFASDDEGDGGGDDDEESDWEEGGGAGGVGAGGSGAKKGGAFADDGGDSDASSDWGEEGAVFAGEDEE